TVDWRQTATAPQGRVVVRQAPSRPGRQGPPGRSFALASSALLLCTRVIVTGRAGPKQEPGPENEPQIRRRGGGWQHLLPTISWQNGYAHGTVYHDSRRSATEIRWYWSPREETPCACFSGSYSAA